jgi:PAS domain-containing protein
MLPSAPRPLLAYSRRRRPLKAPLRPTVGQRDLQEIVALVPYIGAQVPHEAKEVVGFIRALLPDPPPLDGLPVVPASRPADPPPQAAQLDLPHFLLSPELNVFMVSDTLEQATGRRHQEFRRYWKDYLETADPDLLQREFEEAIRTREGFSERVHLRMADGSLRGSILRISPRMFHDGSFIGFTAVLIFDRAACA